MRSFLLFSVLFFKILFAIGQKAASPSVLWQKRMGGTANEAWQSVCATADGGMVACGYTSSLDYDAGAGKGNTDVWVVRFSINGDVVWKRRFGGSQIDFANSVIPGEGGGFMIAGVTYSDDGDVSGNHGYSDGWLLKLNDNGEIEWSYLYGGEYFEEAVAVQRAKSGGYVVVGGTCSRDGIFSQEGKGLYDGWVFKVDRYGSLLWQHSLGGGMNDYFYHLDQMSNEGWILGGETFSGDGDISLNHGNSDAWLVSVSKEGYLIWSNTYGGTGYDRYYTVHQINNGDFVASGYCQKAGDFDGIVSKIDPEGNLKTQSFFGGENSDFLFSAEIKEDGSGVFCGLTQSRMEGFPDTGSKGDGWVFEIDSSWMLKWQYVSGGSESDAFVSVYPMGGNRIYAAGYSYSSDNNFIPSNGQQDTWVVSLGTDLISNTHEITLGNDFNIYPNPATSTSKIYIKADEHSIIPCVQILSASGVILKRFIDLQTGEGLQLQGILPGTYWLKIYFNDGTQNIRLLIVE